MTLFSEKKIKTLGGWQQVDAREALKKIFRQLKACGNFGEYADYTAWEKAKYGQNVEKNGQGT